MRTTLLTELQCSSRIDWYLSSYLLYFRNKDQFPMRYIDDMYMHICACESPKSKIEAASTPNASGDMINISIIRLIIYVRI